MARVATALGWIWLTIAVALILLGYGMIAYEDGLGRLQAILSPFNVINWIAVIVTLLPGWGLLQLGKWFHERKLIKEANRAL